MALLEIMKPGWLAVKRNWAPFLLIQSFAAALVVSYYHFGPVRLIAHDISRFKQHYGELFVIVSGAAAGGLLPQAAKAVTRQVERIDRKFWKDTLYIGFVFAFVAVEVNSFYQLQTYLFGNRIDIITLVKKTSFDMFVFTPAIVVPSAMGLFFARSNGFKANSLARIFTWSFFRSYVVTTLPINWAFWIPVVVCVYSLPLELQFPFAQLAEGAWSLIFVFIAGEAAH